MYNFKFEMFEFSLLKQFLITMHILQVDQELKLNLSFLNKIKKTLNNNQ